MPLLYNLGPTFIFKCTFIQKMKALCTAQKSFSYFMKEVWFEESFLIILPIIGQENFLKLRFFS